MTSSIFHRYSHFLMLWCFFIDKLLGKLWNFSRGVTFSRITRYTLQNHALFVSTIIDYLFIAQKMRFSIKEFFSKCDQIRRKNADLVTFNEEILNGKVHFLCSGCHFYSLLINPSTPWGVKRFVLWFFLVFSDFFCFMIFSFPGCLSGINALDFFFFKIWIVFCSVSTF